MDQVMTIALLAVVLYALQLAVGPTGPRICAQCMGRATICLLEPGPHRPCAGCRPCPVCAEAP